MKSIYRFVYLAVAVMTGGARAHSHDIPIFSIDYYLRANTDYVTDLYRVQGAPISASTISVKFSGNYCDIRVDRLEYTAQPGGYLRTALPLGEGVFEIPEGTLQAIKIHFRQVYWDGVTCSLFAFADAGGPVESKLLGIIRYSGGFVDKTPIPVGLSGRIASFRLLIPSHCRNLDVISAGTVVDGVYYSATKVGRDRFRGHTEGANDVSRILISLNGPRNLECDIPVYLGR